MAEPTIEEAFQAALQHHRAGRLPQAEKLYRQIMVIQPALAEAHSNLGDILKVVGRTEEAIAVFRQAIALQPDIPEIHCNLGNALRIIGKPAEGIAAYRQAIALRPNFPAAHCNLGGALKELGQIDEAIAACHRAIVLKPNYPEASVNLGSALQAKGRLDEAIAVCRHAIASKPNFPEAHLNLGCALRAKGQLDGAIAAFGQAIVLRPNFPAAYSNLGDAQWAKGQLDEAIVACRQAIALNANFSEAYLNLGNALKDRGELDGAIAAYRRAIILQPDYHEAHSNLVCTLHFHPGYDAAAMAEEHRGWNRQHAWPLKPFIQLQTNDRNPARRLRLGYVSPDFREHPVGRFLLPLLVQHDRKSFEVFAYSQVRVPDGVTERLRSLADGWRNIAGCSDLQVTEMIRQDKIDILVDLTMHLSNNRLLVFARKPAPVQVTYLAYCSTTGLETIDYRLSDPYLDPAEGDASIYSESTIRLPETYWCYQPLAVASEVSPPPALQNGFVTFGCLNNFCKVSEPTLAAWAKLLRTVPNSQLLIHAQEGRHRESVWDRMDREGVTSKRIQFVGFMPTEKYFAYYHRIDIALDTFPYGGGTTTCDALWMGVPLVSLAGKTAVSRGGLSILSNVGLPELVARSEERYVQIAVELAADLGRLSALRSTLRQRMQQSPLMDAPRFARNVETAYRTMWRSWCDGGSAP